MMVFVLDDVSKRMLMKMMTLWLTLVLTLAAGGRLAAAVEFPGPPPGQPRATQDGGVFTLENDACGAAWKLEEGTLRPLWLGDALRGRQYDQSGAELFRLALAAPKLPATGVWVEVRLETNRVVALASRDGVAWVEMAEFPRADFPGKPALVRLGKMNLQAQSRDNPGDLGAAGECVMADVNPPLWQSNRWVFRARAHQAATVETLFPAGTKSIRCRIDKETDQGMSWGPALALVWEDGRRFLLVGLRDATPVFNVTTATGERLCPVSLATYPVMDAPASSFRLVAPPRLAVVPAEPASQRLAGRFAAETLEATFTNAAGLRACWRAELRAGANYLRETLELSAPTAMPLNGVELIDAKLAGAKTVGTSPGSPVVADGLFLGVEMPGSQNALSDAEARIGFGCRLELAPGRSYTFGAVQGVAPAGQLRRAFLYYLERERARPSSPFLHYNGWYDLGFGVNATNLLTTVGQFQQELAVKRGVPVLSYLVDDGWDDPAAGLWRESREKFPDGFKGLAARMGPEAHLGIWISPLGGYGGADERTAQARRLGLIPPDGSLDLSFPGYQQWFQDRCRQLIREDGVNLFKWDRAGDGVTPHFMALLEVARNLRRERPDLFINVTVGTWPSPFWLNHVDCTWRNGTADVGWAGKGNARTNSPYNRERWLTFRDGSCYAAFVRPAPLYPLNSCMHHGIVQGREFQGGSIGQNNPPDLKNEARSYFANGAMLQELYLTPALLTPAAWDEVAEAAKWAHANADVLVDAHWVGGDPLKLEPYGYAAWNRRKGTLMVRNPDDRPQSLELDAAAVFELPAGAPQAYRLKSPYADQRVHDLALRAGQPRALTLEPFEVLVFDADPELGEGAARTLPGARQANRDPRLPGLRGVALANEVR